MPQKSLKYPEVLQIRVAEGTRAMLAELAELERRTISEVVREAIRQLLSSEPAQDSGLPDKEYINPALLYRP